MRRLRTAGLAALTLAAATPALATGSAPGAHTCKVDLRAKFVDVEVLSGQPPQSGSNTNAAIVDRKLCGQPFHGAIRDVNHFPSFGKVRGRGQLFGPLGSLRLTFAAEATINPDHSASLRGTSKVIGGTGAYRGATGSGTFTGFQGNDSSFTSDHLTGTFRY